MPKQMTRIVLARHCEGPPRLEDFAFEHKPIPEPNDGEFLVRHIFNSVDPGTRSRLSGIDSYAQALSLGKIIDGFAVGEVEVSKHPDYPKGTTVVCASGWRTHSIQNGKRFIGKVPENSIPKSVWIGVLGVPGLTAYFGLKDVAKFKEGDRVLVTSAAGPVGATAGQLAKLWKAEKVVGIAGSDHKNEWLEKQANFDATINYKSTSDLSGAIDEQFPDGIDVLFDNVGNEMINRVLPKMRLNGRICVSGQVADYNKSPSEVAGVFNTSPFITHRVLMQGLVVFDFANRFPEAIGEIAGAIMRGDLQWAEERFEGIEQMPEAFCGLFQGENFGRRVVKVGEE